MGPRGFGWSSIPAGRQTTGIWTAGMDTRVISNMGHWWSGFAALHGSEGNVTIGEWSYVGGSLYARKIFNRSGTVGEGIYTETTTLELWHRPRR